MARLFGTDGIRGKANTYPITCEIALKAGRAVGNFVKKQGFDALVIGRDTRISGKMLEAAIAAGAASSGVDVLLAGVIPTPGVARLCACMEGVGAGVVISASHNPYFDNGIKIFGRGGVKLNDDEEIQMESQILDREGQEAGSLPVGTIRTIKDGLSTYGDFLLSTFSGAKPEQNNRSELKLVIDASNGAASKIGPMVFDRLGFETVHIHNEPDGFNINENCGSQHTESLRDQVVKTGARIGLAFDGDADRLIAVDETGHEITGDQILAICAKYAKEKGRLKNNILVTTTMSNMGLGKALDSLGITHLKSDVGDRKVLEEMKRSGAVMGGEDSGHMIFLEDHTTGDGMLSALKLLEIMVETGQPLSQLASVMTVFPQVLINVEVDPSKPDFTGIPAISDAIARVEQALGEKGRVLVRYSGTQPMIRVMVEGPDPDQTRSLCETICQAVQESLPLN